MHWRRKWQPTTVFLPEESYGWQSLVGCRLWGRTESDPTEATQQENCIDLRQRNLIYASHEVIITKSLASIITSAFKKLRSWQSIPITLWQIDEEKMETVTDLIKSPKSLQTVIAAMKLKDTCSLEEKG